MGVWKSCGSAELSLLGFRCSFCRSDQPRREDDDHGCGAHWTAHPKFSSLGKPKPKTKENAKRVYSMREN